jgi:hypothetical protein
VKKQIGNVLFLAAIFLLVTLLPLKAASVNAVPAAVPGQPKTEMLWADETVTTTAKTSRSVDAAFDKKQLVVSTTVPLTVTVTGRYVGRSPDVLTQTIEVATVALDTLLPTTGTNVFTVSAAPAVPFLDVSVIPQSASTATVSAWYYGQ